MRTRETGRWLAGIALGACAIALTARIASADHRLEVMVDNTGLGNGTCLINGNGNIVMGEAWGQDSNANRQCEAMSIGGTAMAQCPTSATQHVAMINERGSQDAHWIDILSGPSSPQTTWTSQSQQMTYQEPPSSNCPNGSGFYVVSQGFEVP
jgi:hypothetical protein